ncbi:MAG: pyruvate kinase [Bacteroidota bacterium]|nr:pyruvate kinase [Bacteroidota bacterium]
MQQKIRRAKIVATIGPASRSPEIIRQLILAGMNVARLNFSHGSYEDHASVLKNLREISEELDIPITILQDLQGPKVRVGILPSEQLILNDGDLVTLVPEDHFKGEPGNIPIDYPHIAEESKPGMQVLMDDGLLELVIQEVKESSVVCKVVEGGILKSRKGVNFPNLMLKLPSLTEKDKKDLEFGLSQGVDWVSLSFVRTAEDVLQLKNLIQNAGFKKPVIAKIEKPQAIDHLEEILDVVDGIMVARGDLGVEMSPEKVPMLQKLIIESCNRRGIPVITATQMLESMIHEARPTRAEANDVANAIIDGTDCVMLSGESAIGEHPVKSVEMMNRIAMEVESKIEFKTYPAIGSSEITALSEAAIRVEKIVKPTAIVVITTTGASASYIAAERPKIPIYALTPDLKVYHMLNLLWGIKPIVAKEIPSDFEEVVHYAGNILVEKSLAEKGNKIVVIGGVPTNVPGGTNFLKIHTID